VLAIITQGNLAIEQGLTIKTEPVVGKEDIPDKERDCMAYRLPAPILQVAPAIGKIDGWAVKGGRDGLVVPWKGQRNVEEGWIGRADGEDLMFCLWVILVILSVSHSMYVSRC
jgi:hypothetical protein